MDGPYTPEQCYALAVENGKEAFNIGRAGRQVEGDCAITDLLCGDTARVGVADWDVYNLFVDGYSTVCASEKSDCVCDGYARLGADTRWTDWYAVTDGSVYCHKNHFGGNDPAIGTMKACECFPKAPPLDGGRDRAKV